ncbi:MAG TPA: hypothetical protein DCL35_01235 [Candidatus Omnitrophica bacterium]|nr:hypothetical protein [Candidatus Omnitrophota bacterium]
MKTCLAIVACLLCFAACPLAHADAVYLKNGKVMRGRIVEKTQEHIVLKTGEGEYAVRNTIYLEDISRIQTEQEYSSEAKFIPAQLFRQDFKKLWEQGAPLPTPVEPEKEEYIKPIEEPGQDVGRLKPAAAPLPFGQVDARGVGTISGFVRLPEDEEKRKGDLYIYIMKEAGPGRFILPSGNFLYQVIGGDSITSVVLPYRFDNIDAGTYKVFAIWDTALPFIKKKKIRGSEMLVGLGLKGDYMGMQSGEVSIIKDRPDGIVNIESLVYISKDQPGALMPQEDEYLVSDIYYRKIAAKDGGLFLLVKNQGEDVIDSLELDLFINDEKAGAVPIEIGPIQAHQEKEFDISRNFEVYRKQKEKEGWDIMGKLTRFKIVSRKRGELELEKAIFIL